MSRFWAAHCLSFLCGIMIARGVATFDRWIISCWFGCSQDVSFALCVNICFYVWGHWIGVSTEIQFFDAGKLVPLWRMCFWHDGRVVCWIRLVQFGHSCLPWPWLFWFVMILFLLQFHVLSQRRVGVSYALRVSPAVTRLTVHRRPQVSS